MTSAYDSVVGGKLRLKGKPLPLQVKTGEAISKKKKIKIKDHDGQLPTGGGNMNAPSSSQTRKDLDENETRVEADERLTPAERRSLQQWEKIELQRITKMATKPHRDRIQEFNQYLANLTEHYDIPKVGPG